MALIPIRRVVVHRDGAIVHREGEARVIDGRITVAGLPLSLDPSSLRVRVAGGAAGSLQLRLDTEGWERPDPIDAERALREARRALQAHEDALRGLRLQRDAIGAQVPAGPTAEGESPPSAAALRAWAAVEPTLAAWTTALDEAERAGEEAVRRAKQEVEAARWRVDRLGAGQILARWRPGWVLQIDPEAVDAAAERVAVALSYRVTAARWTPAYALQVDGAFRRGRLVLRALVAQDTGEDWTDVAMAVSAASCLRRVELPELPSLRLGSAGAAPPSPWRDLPEDLDALFPPDLPPPERPAPPPPPRRPAPEAEEFDTMAVSAPAPLADAPMPPPSPRRSTAAPMPPASAPPPEPMRARSAPTASIAAMLSGAGGAAPAKPAQPPDLPGPLEVSADLLDYPALRMAPWHSPDRGRLRPAKLATLASEASLPAEAADRLGEARGQRDEAAARLARLALPPHTPAEGPAEGAWHQLELPDRARVPSDGAWHPLGAGEEELSIELRYRAIPRLDARAFRRVTARRTQTAPLLPGPLDVLIDGALQRTLPWAGAGRGHELRLELGVEDHLRVARNVHYTEDSVGIFGGERRLHTHIKVEVASALSRDAVVELIDRLPVADEDGLSVVLAASEPKAEPWAGEVEQSPLEGARLQTLTVKAGGQASASLHYHVTLPTRRELVGGDRRG